MDNTQPPKLTVSSDCLLEGISFSLEKNIKSHLTIVNPKYIAAKRFGRWIGKNLKPELKYYEPTPGGIRFPRGFSNQAVILTRKHMGVSPQIVDKRRRLEDISLSFTGKLRPYQQLAVDKVTQRSFGVLEAGTGSGKTVMALAITAERAQPTLIVVHTKELLYQWKERINDFLGIEPGLIGDSKWDIQPITVAIVNSARKKVKELVPLFGQLIIDECHRVPATLFTDVVSNFDSFYLLGLSATAYRSEDEMTKLIYYYMGNSIHRVNQDELKLTGAIVRPRVLRKETGFDYNYKGDYQALIKALTSHEGRNMQIVTDILRQLEDDKNGTALVVSDRVSHCSFFHETLQNMGIHTALLTGQTPADKRSKIVEQVQENKVQVLIATLQLISEGFDCPGLSSLFLTTPITFEGRLLQVIGRIMRPKKDKQATVYDYVDYSVSALRRSANSRLAILQSL